VRVPEKAVGGKAKVTLSLAGWKEGNVPLATFEVPIAEAKQKKSSGVSSKK
jgi:hypothetical protein